MIQATAKAIVSLFERRGAIRPDKREVYIYGCDIALYTLFSTLGLLALGAALGRLRETALCVGIFYMNQSFGGGYHADTHLRCFVTMASGLLVFILSLSLPLPPITHIISGYLSLVLLYAVPLVLHKNKAYLARHKQQLIKRSRLVTLAQFSIFLLAGLLPGSGMAQVFGSALALCSVSRLAAKRVQHEKKALNMDLTYHSCRFNDRSCQWPQIINIPCYNALKKRG